ncbi:MULTISPECIES: MarR family winged helix-turn-helix transcriptional regulator [unclassified Rhizobium]|uniref:MarR family winged helix-turn-helix transcriptional regulator n=2 Tax=Rhizobium TaxID=379 RepID=UPI000712C1A1|nr:MarR family transcriptional regulator [Rhizobium sp. Leaf386]KQT05001.1 MarR family transcriptional regulator [Rhizobium sp. Leaf391]KQU08803.1 MarR family transcriptional regulator [Rhizobium sp. Leaf453]
MQHATAYIEQNEDLTEKEANRASIGRSMGRWRLMVGRRVLARLAIDNVAPGLEITHLDVLDAVWRARGEGEVTVGTIAEIMRIDPSRASRIVADMVTRGALKREASQADARRIIVVMTELGTRLIGEIKAVKRGVIESILADWPEEDVGAFAHLFDRFVGDFEAFYQNRENAGQKPGVAHP